MTILLRAFLILIMTATLARGASAKGLCDDPRIPPPGAGGGCEAYSLRYADGDAEADVQLAKVYRGSVHYIDLTLAQYEHYLRRPDGAIINLGQFRQESSGWADGFLLNGLDIGGYEGRRAQIGVGVFFDQRLERVRDLRRGDRYCMTYRMKPPFLGVFQDCNGRSTPVGTVNYSPGTVTWREATQRACSQALLAPGRCFDIGITNLVERDAGGGVYYVVTIRQPELWGWTYLVYRIDAAGGAVTLLKETGYTGEAREWMDGQGGPTNWMYALCKSGWMLLGAALLLIGRQAWRLRRRRRQFALPVER
jgi:hypothetical protein